MDSKGGLKRGEKRISSEEFHLQFTGQDYAPPASEGGVVTEEEGGRENEFIRRKVGGESYRSQYRDTDWRFSLTRGKFPWKWI